MRWRGLADVSLSWESRYRMSPEGYDIWTLRVTDNAISCPVSLEPGTLESGGSRKRAVSEIIKL